MSSAMEFRCLLYKVNIDVSSYIHKKNIFCFFFFYLADPKYLGENMKEKKKLFLFYYMIAVIDYSKNITSINA